ncbi:myelin regulatory factor-like protein isoform X2 [Lineus longissimus]|uniref:myelin regulatory factor-like protein isoform X2 n=1 Tax=Lineus longissimus TaxID=88925 RepID=UPI002B4D4D30
MEGLGDEQVLQALNGLIEGGVDNGALELFAEYMNTQDPNSLLFPDDVISSGLGSSPASHKVAPPDYPTSVFQQHGDSDINNRGSHAMQYRNQAFISPSLPDSPPDTDSSSEPYSPPSDHSKSVPDTGQMNGHGNLPSVVTNINNGFHDDYMPNQQQHGNHLAKQILTASQSLPPGYGSSEMFPLQAPSPHEIPSPQQTPMRVSPNSSQMSPHPSQSRRNKTKAPQPGQAPQINTRMLPGATAHSGESFKNSHLHKKRKHSISPQASVNPASLNVTNLADLLKKEPIKQEPGTLPSCGDETLALQEMLDLQSELGHLDVNYQLIKFQPFHHMKYMTLLDGNLSELPAPVYHVSADKGFNFSTVDESFVCQKKNHFQVTVSIQVSGEPQFVQTPDGCMKIDNFYVHFHGIKADSPSSKIKVEQSQADRSKKPFYPVLVDLPADQVTKVTVGRLHFSETTTNNMRKKGKPNPDQRYFMLAVELRAHCGDTNHLISSMVSEKIIVRASNPGQFDSDMEYPWQKGQNGDVVYRMGRVGINTDNPEEALAVHGNIKMTGHLVQPSDIRAKENITEMDSREQLEHVQRMKIYKYLYNRDYAEQAGLSEDELEDTGVLAQELREVLPDAVTETGDVILSNGDTIEKFLVVNKDRIYMENVGAVKELCKLTDNLENRIDELERVNKKLSKLKRLDSLKSTGSGKSFSSSITMGSRYLPSKESVKQRHRPTPPPPEDGICSNRFIQIAIIVLVLVMAFCLIAMVTLYILEKNEGSGSMATISATSGPVIIGTTPRVSAVPSTTTKTAGVATAADGKPFITQQTAPTEYIPVPASKATTSAPTIPSLVPVTARPVPVELTPKRCLTNECEKMCCRSIGNTEGKMPYYYPTSADRKNNTFMPEIVHGEDAMRVRIDNYEQPIQFENPARKKKPPRPPRLPSSLTKPPPHPLINNNGHLNVPPGNNHSNISIKHNVIFRRKRRRRGAKEGEYDIKTITIKGNNQWDDFPIDRKYCTDKCNNGNYSYSVRVSQYVPVEKLEVEFTTPLALMITFCGHGSGKQIDCSSTEPAPDVEETATMGPIHKWNLPIGYAFHIWFKFRVADKNAQDDVCSKPVSEVGVTYTEYTFKFFRDDCKVKPQS